MPYHFRNLVFEGGGVKGMAYLGAMQVLQEKGILAGITRVGGTSVGAINAALVALGYTNAEQRDILWKLNFKNFMDGTWGILPNLSRVIRGYGWYKGNCFREWMAELIARKLNNPQATFKDLRDKGKPDLFVYGTNLCTGFGEVFSVERTPEMKIADAVRISMSIPIFFAAVRNAGKEVYVDGGCLNNYPIKLFDREKYIRSVDLLKMGLHRDYYDKQNESFLKEHPASSPYIYNKQTLGFRLDSKEEIAAFRYNEPQSQKIDHFYEYATALVKTMLDCQNNAHLHSDDWQRTIYIDTLGVSTTDFGLTDEKKTALEESGKLGVANYFEWFDSAPENILNRPS
jgi:NTE family protein